METIEKLDLLSAVTNIPIRCYSQQKTKYQSVELNHFQHFAEHISQKELDFSKPYDFAYASDMICIGFIKDGASGDTILFGPVSNIKCDAIRAQFILKTYGMSIAETNSLLSYFESIPRVSISKFSKFISLAVCLINGKEINTDGFLFKDYADYDSDEKIIEEKGEIENVHDGFTYEKQLFSYIQLGNIEKMKNLNLVPSVHEGMLANDPLRHKRNLMIASTTLAARAAVKGGLNYNVSMTIADSFIQKYEIEHSSSKIGLLHKKMLMTFTKAVAESKMNFPNSSIAYKIKSYIEKNIMEKINTQEIADELKISRTYLSSKFKKETGKNLSDYIMEIKIDEAKLLLKTTEMPAVDIANTLAFSSQSYFQSNFKKLSGITPKQFRQNEEERGF